MFRKTIFLCLSCLFSVMAFISLSEGGNVILSGAGATFPHPLYKKWIDMYREETGIRTNYLAVGSGSGIRQLLGRKIDFGATDAFMSPGELERARGDILHIPTCLGAVTIIYHLPGNPILKFTPELISDIFLGKISSWSDEEILAVNPEIRLPDLEISVVHRSDGSGTTFVFTDYLSKANPVWRKKVGHGKKVQWLTGMGVEGNPNVAKFVKKIPGAIGYVQLAYAKRNNLPFAFVKNRSGHFIGPTLKSVSSAADIVLPPDTRILITDTDAPDGYPISAFTWLIFYKEQSYNNRSYDKACQLGRFLWWATHEGQQYNNELFYAPLPRGAVRKAEAIIRSMRFTGEPFNIESSGDFK
ncbi:MAG: phosphate ABC transporter substrate-binding protein PstS [Thermodesulfobacteriota bacterium]|nr:phosphate ABC transporter substrate-binding protein PstS [Thermodesulfobacteriota bacterium]